MALLLVAAGFFWMAVAGLVFDDRLVLPGLFGFLFCLACAVWVSLARVNRAVAEFRLRERERVNERRAA